MTTGRPLRVANCSGFYGDRLSAAREMVDGGPVDVLTGDWLAELTMGVLGRQLMNDPDAGYARTFVTQLDDVLADCLDRGIKIVSNAGGLNPAGCAKQIEAIGARTGRDVKVAVVTGDDATGAFRAARAAGWDAPHLDTSAPVSGLKAEPLLANAYLGGWAITEALAAGADVVVTGRVTDAALISGPAAWHFGWARDDWDKLAGAVAAGHVIECGAQATGGNFAFFTEIPDLSHPGFPLAEISEDGSAVITKHPGTGGAVTVDTVTAQLLYEVNGPRYLGPDVITRLDTVRLEQDGPDRVRVSGVRGEPPTASVKVGALIPGGWRNEGTFVLTGLDIEEKANLAQAALWAHVPGGEKAFDQVTVRLLRAGRPDPPTMHEAVALLTITVSGQDPKLVAGFSRAAVETGLGSYPGLTMTAPPGKGSPVLVFWPTLMPAKDFAQTVTLGERSWDVPLTATFPAASTTPAAFPAGTETAGAGGASEDPFGSPVMSPASGPHPGGSASPGGQPPQTPPTYVQGASPGGQPPQTPPTYVQGASPGGQPPRTPSQDKRHVPGGQHPRTPPASVQGDTVRMPLGTLLGARSGDKAGNATLGVWARDDAAHRWLRSWWTEPRLRELLPETAGLELRLWEFPLLRACGVTIVGLLGAGVAANHALDGQAKALGEYLRAKVADIPAGLLPAGASLRARHRGERAGAAGEHRGDERLNRRPLAGSRVGQQD